MIFTRDGTRQLACARSEDEAPIERDQEVVVTSYRGGIAYVRTWAALTGENPQTLFRLKDPGTAPRMRHPPITDPIAGLVQQSGGSSERRE